MRKVRELLRLKFDQRLSDRKIAVALSMSRSAVGECLHRAATAAVTWPLPEGLDDAELERRLYPVKAKAVEIPWPDFAHLQRELSRPGVTGNCCGWSTKRSTRTGCSTAPSASDIASGCRTRPSR